MNPRLTEKTSEERIVGERLPLRQLVRLRFSVSTADIETEEGRSRERYFRVALTTVSSVAAKLATLLTLVISVPLTLKYLGVERFGMWMTIASGITMLSCADFGIGNGLLNLLSETNGNKDSEGARSYVSSAFYMLVTVGGALLTIALVVYPFVRWERLLNVATPEAVRDSGPTFFVLMICFAINLPLGIAQRIHSGYQEGYISNLWAVLGSSLALVAVIVAVRMHASLPILLLGFAGAPVIALLFNTIWLFAYHKPWLKPSLGPVRLDTVKRLFRMGFLFFVLQVGLAVGFQSDTLVLDRILGAGQVAQYAVAVRLFSFLPMLLNFVIMPLWPAYGEAFARGDINWLKRTLLRSLILVVGVTVPMNLFLVITGERIIGMWVGPHIVPPMALLVGLAISQTLFAVASPVSVFLNALSILKFQAVCFAAMAILNISASVYLTQHLGVTGVVFGSIIAQVVCWIAPALIFVPRLLRSLDESPSFVHLGSSNRDIAEGS